MDRLLRYSWPGNIRELRNVLERAFLLAGDQAPSATHFPGLQESSPAESEPESRIEVRELAHIRNILAKCEGNVDQAAKELGISRATLYRRLKQIRVS